MLRTIALSHLRDDRCHLFRREALGQRRGKIWITCVLLQCINQRRRRMHPRLLYILRRLFCQGLRFLGRQDTDLRLIDCDDFRTKSAWFGIFDGNRQRESASDLDQNVVTPDYSLGDLVSGRAVHLDACTEELKFSLLAWKALTGIFDRRYERS